MSHDTYESPLATRNASPRCSGSSRRATSSACGAGSGSNSPAASASWASSRISAEALQQMEAKLDDIDFDAAAAGKNASGTT